MADKPGQRDELEAKDRRIDELIAEAEKNLAALMAVVDEMKRQGARSAGDDGG